jgi:hypothetical protein
MPRWSGAALPDRRSAFPPLAACRGGIISEREGATHTEDVHLTTKRNRFAQGGHPTLVSLLVAAGVSVAPVRAQEMPFIDAARGTLLIHGNYCGPGNRSPRPPIDALDLACMHHDQCSPPRGQIATCACNDRLHEEAEAVSQDPNQPESLRDTAGFVADTATALPCR